MKTKNLFMLSILSFIPFFLFSQYRLNEGYITIVNNAKVHQSFTYKQLRIYPLVAGEKFQDAHKDIGEYTNLEQALKSNKVKIVEGGNLNTPIQERPSQEVQQVSAGFEQVNQTQTQNISNQSAGDQVNTLYIKNNSQDTIYLMAGEVIKGGKQDRILAQDMVLPPDTNYVDLSVFCVEHGRWSYGSKSPVGFQSYATVSHNTVRHAAAKEKNQQKVWGKVKEVTTAHQAESSTGTYNALEKSEDFNKNKEEYLSFMNKALDSLDNCIGFVGVTGDKIIGCDLFATPDLFRNQRKNLLNAYVSEAITSGDEIKIKDEKVVSYLNTFLSDEEKQDEEIKSMGVDYKFRKKRLHITTF